VKRLLHARERDPELTRLLTGTADDPKIKICTYYIENLSAVVAYLLKVHAQA
jgi:hypothetical protein